jgi:hypothetical protein
MPLLTVALAAVGTMVGILIGAKLEAIKWRAEKRHAIYSKFSQTATNAHRLFAVEVAYAMKLADPNRLARTEAAFLSAVHDADACARELNFLCSDPTGQAAKGVITNLYKKLRTAEQFQQRGLFDKEEWATLKKEGWATLAEFERRAAKDLGVRRRTRKTSSLHKEEEWMIEASYLEAMMRMRMREL